MTRIECQSRLGLRPFPWEIMFENLDVRAVRSFVAVAEELHFTRAAARLFVAEQALSRDIRRLERRLGLTLFVRTTRHVELTPEGRALLDDARRLLALNDRILGAAQRRDRAVLVDVVGDRLTGWRVLEAARADRPEIEFVARHGGGLGAALGLLQTGALDVAFGRVGGLPPALTDGLDALPVRLEPLGLLLPADHALAQLPAIPGAALAGQEIDISDGNARAPEWVDLGRQLVALLGAVAQPPHASAEGADETARHLARERLPILTHLDAPRVENGVIRPIVEPVPLYPWSIVTRPGDDLAGIAALHAAAAELAAAEGWLARSDGSWLPEPEAATAP